MRLYINDETLGECYIGTRSEFRKLLGQIIEDQYRGSDTHMEFPEYFERTMNAGIRVATEDEILHHPHITEYLMNPYTGTVQTKEDWRSDHASMSLEEWGGKEFSDADLIPVYRNLDNEWIEK